MTIQKPALALALTLSLASLSAAAQSFDPFSGNFAGVTERCDDATGWCHENAPVGNQLAGVWALNDADAWAVGSRGVAVHWDGNAWTLVETGIRTDLTAVWGAATDDVWAVGANGIVLHWDGAAFSPMYPGIGGLLLAVSGTATDDVWMIGADGMAAHWDGASFLASNTGGHPTSIFAIAPGDALAAGNAGCYRWNGVGFSPTACGIRGSAAGVWASAPDDIWVASSSLYRGDAFADRAHWDGTAWTTEIFSQCGGCGHDPNYPGQLRTVSGSAANDVWINGTLHWNGASWTRFNFYDQDSISVTGSGNVFGVQNQIDLTFLSGGARTTLATTRPRQPLAQVRGSDPADVYVVSEQGGVVRFDGAQWTTLSAPGVDLYPSTVFGTGSSDIWVGGGNQWHFDGSSWTQVVVDPLASGISTGWSRSATDAIAFGSVQENGLYRNASWHWDGATWSRNSISFGDDSLGASWGSSPADVWVVGNHYSPVDHGTNAAWHWDGASWSRFAPNGGYGFTSVFGVASNDVWMLADNGLGQSRIFHSNGAGIDHTELVSGQLVAATSASDVWTAGKYRQELMHWNGAAWNQVRAIWPYGLSSLWAVPGSAVYAVTPEGGLYRRTGN